MFEFTGEAEPFINLIFLIGTGSIAAVFFFMVLFQDVLELVQF